MAQDFELGEKVGSAINPKLAAIVKSSFTKKLAEEKMRSLMDNYHPPKNCDSLTTVKVNPEIWAKLKYETKTKDLELQKTQAKLNKAVMALSTPADTHLSEKGKGKPTSTKLGECVKTVLDAIALVGAANQDFHSKRREQVNPDLNSQYRLLCSNTVPVTSHLFGDDLAKTLKDIVETNHVGAKVASTSRKASNKPYNRGKPFLGHKKPLYQRYNQTHSVSGYKHSGNNSKPYKKGPGYKKSTKQD